MKVSCISFILIFLLVSCSSTQGRNIASIKQNTCSIEKKADEPSFYRVLINGKASSKKWVGDREANRTLRRLEMQGECDILN
jgi:uncharacterized protein YcfL